MPWIVSTILSIFIPLAAIYVYVCRRLYKSLRIVTVLDPKNIKRVTIVSALLLNVLPILFLATFLLWGREGTKFFSGDYRLVDILVVYPFWFALVIVVQLFLLIILLDVGTILFYSLYRRNREKWRIFKSKTILAIASFVAIYSVIAIIAATWNVRTVTKEVLLPDSFASLDGTRIALIADVQGDGRTTPALLRSFVEQVNSLQPDFIFFAGDLVTSGEKYVASSAEALSRLKSTYSPIAVIGDHDIFSNKEMISNSLDRHGFIVLPDTTIAIEHNGASISVTGVTYTYRKRPDGDALEDMSNGNDGMYKVMVSHQPANSLVAYAQSKGYDLFLAGHTHGGGIAFGIPGLFLVAPASFETRYVSGFYQLGKMLVAVTNGLGFTLAPIRFHAPAEITLLILRRSQAS
jgi:predicted MPP superfamily phosphohydrolase